MTTQERESIILAMYDYIPELFPTMEWKKMGDKWVSPYHLNGEKDRTKGAKSSTAIVANAKHAIHDITRGESREIIDYYIETTGLLFNDAIDEICRVCQIDPPQRDAEKEKERQERKEKSNSLVEIMRNDISSQYGANVRGYLTAPREIGGRGWSEPFVSWLIAEGLVGVTTMKLVNDIESLTGSRFTKTEVNGDWKNVWETHHLFVPTFNKGGDIIFAKTRTIDPNVKGGKSKWNNLSTEISHLYNYNRANALSPGKNAKKLIIMESELCVLHSEFTGVHNCISIQGSGGLKATEIRSIELGRFSKVVILLDNDTIGKSSEEKEAKNEETIKKTRRLINSIRKTTSKLNVFVAHIPDELGCKDPDDILSTHPTDGGHILQSLIDNAVSAPIWEAQLIAKKYNDATNDSDRMDAKDELIQSGSLMTDIDRKEYNATFVKETGTPITEEDFIHAEEAKETEEATKEYAIDMKNAIDRLQKALNGGDQEAIEKAKKELEELHRPTTKIDVELTPRTMEEMYKELSEDFGEDIETEYRFKVKKKTDDGQAFEDVPLIFRSGQLTFVGGGQGHGKTSILQSFAYYIASKHYAETLNKGKRKKVIYYGFEELKKDSVAEFINIDIHAQPFATDGKLFDLSPKGSSTAITEYIKGAKAEDAFSNVEDKSILNDIEAEIRTFFEDYRGAVKKDGSHIDPTLYIYDQTMTSKQLVEHARRKSRTIHPDAIVIDYVQFLTSGDPKAQTWEDTTKVTRDILNLAKELKIPIILGAQLNRDAAALIPGTMEKRHLANSSAIEKDGNTIILIFNSKEESGRVNYFGRSVNETEDGINLGEEGHIFLKLVKNRGGKSPGMGVYHYDGGKRFLSWENLMSPDEIQTEATENHIVYPKNRKK